MLVLLLLFLSVGHGLRRLFVNRLLKLDLKPFLKSFPSRITVDVEQQMESEMNVLWEEEMQSLLFDQPKTSLQKQNKRLRKQNKKPVVVEEKEEVNKVTGKTKKEKKSSKEALYPPYYSTQLEDELILPSVETPHQQYIASNATEAGMSLNVKLSSKRSRFKRFLTRLVLVTKERTNSEGALGTSARHAYFYDGSTYLPNHDFLSGGSHLDAFLHEQECKFAPIPSELNLKLGAHENIYGTGAYNANMGYSKERVAYLRLMPKVLQNYGIESNKGYAINKTVTNSAGSLVPTHDTFEKSREAQADKIIHLVNDYQSLLCMNRIVNADINGIEIGGGSGASIPVLGFDCEWKPDAFHAQGIARSYDKKHMVIEGKRARMSTRHSEQSTRRVRRGEVGNAALISSGNNSKDSAQSHYCLRIRERLRSRLTNKRMLIDNSLEDLLTLKYLVSGTVSRKDRDRGSRYKLSDGKKGKTKKKGENSPVSLLQMSTRKHVFILDMLALSRTTVVLDETDSSAVVEEGCIRCIPLQAQERRVVLTTTEALLDKVLRKTLCSQHFVKIGVSPLNDLKRLMRSYSHLPVFSGWESSGTISNVLDLSMLFKTIYPQVPGKHLEGLSKLTTYQLGFALDKSMQCSNWNRRPLSRTQLAYSSLDACVQVTLFDNAIQSYLHFVSSHNKSDSMEVEKLLRKVMIEYRV